MNCELCPAGLVICGAPNPKRLAARIEQKTGLRILVGHLRIFVKTDTPVETRAEIESLIAAE